MARDLGRPGGWMVVVMAVLLGCSSGGDEAAPGSAAVLVTSAPTTALEATARASIAATSTTNTSTSAPSSTTAAPTSTVVADVDASVAEPRWWEDYRPGDCFDSPIDGGFGLESDEQPWRVPCGGPHDFQVYATFELPNVFGGRRAAGVEQSCDRPLRQFLGSASELEGASGFHALMRSPNRDEWNAGVRSGICYLARDVWPLTGSAQSGWLEVPDHELVAMDRNGLYLIDTSDPSLGVPLVEFEWDTRPDSAVSARDIDGELVVAYVVRVNQDTDVEDRPDLWRINLLRSGVVTTLVEGMDQLAAPDLSPDGRWLAYHGPGSGGTTDIFLMELETGETTQVTFDYFSNYTPSFSSDGSQLAYSRGWEARNQIESITLSGEHEVWHHWGQAQDEFNPRWSPDGSQILYTTDKKGNLDIWLMDVESGDRRPLVNHEANDTFANWSPDGRFIVFQSDRHGEPVIWVTTDGSDQTRLPLPLGLIGATFVAQR